METPEELLVMRQLLERGWSRRRIATELGISRHTVNRYLALGSGSRTARPIAMASSTATWSGCSNNSSSTTATPRCCGRSC